jgi:hypothetical protein
VLVVLLTAATTVRGWASDAAGADQSAPEPQA